MRIKFKIIGVALFTFINLITTSESIRNKVIILSMIIGGKTLGFDDASQILFHYCFSGGDSLKLDPCHLQNCTVILNEVKQMKVGEKKKVFFRQNQCWQLSYSLMGFELKRESDSIYIHQYIQFDKTGKVFTYLNVLGRKIKIYDNIVHTFNCTPFVAYTSFPYKRPSNSKS
jgi:hypothetical protein